MLVRDVLAVKAGEIFSVAPEVLVTEAIGMMVSRNIGSLVVLDEAGKVAGIITERDVLRATHKHACDLTKLRVEDLMTTRLILAGPEDTVDHARGIMTENRIRHLPVMLGDELIGLLTFHDVAKAVLEQTNFENQLLKKYIKDWPEETAETTPGSGTRS